MSKHIGARWIYLAAVEGGWFNRPDMTPIDAAYSAPYFRVTKMIGLKNMYQ